MGREKTVTNNELSMGMQHAGCAVHKEQLAAVHRIQIEILNEIVQICNRHNLQYFLIAGSLLGAVRHRGFIPWDDDLDIAMPRQDYTRFLAICEHELSSTYVADHYGTNPKYWQSYAKIRKNGTVYELKSQVGIEGIPKGVWVDVFPLDNIKPGKIFVTIQAFAFKLIKSNIATKQLPSAPKTMKRRIVSALLAPLSVDASFELLHKVMTFWNTTECDYFALFFDGDEKKRIIPKSKYFPPKHLEFEGGIYEAPNDPHYILEKMYGDYMKLPPLEERLGHGPVFVDLGNYFETTEEDAGEGSIR